MGTDSGTTTTSVAAAIRERASRFTFLQALWLLHRAAPDAPAMGTQGPPEAEPVRLRPSASLAFPPGDIESFESFESAAPAARMTTTFMGLYGANSPLPSFYSEDILRRTGDEEDHTTRAFLDIFNHRLLSLLYRGLLKYRGHMLFAAGGKDEFSWRLYALSGILDADPGDPGGLPRQRLLRFAGIWSRRPRSAAALASILATWFGGLEITVRQCVARWVYLNDGLRSQLGQRSCKLGNDATIGARIQDHTGKYRIRIGPVDFDTYREFLPGSESLATVRRLAKRAIGDPLDFDVEMVLRGDETPRLGLTLSRQGNLGWTTGLFSRPAEDLSVVFA
ncbi:MAG: type VI secretion system baseplate subunit TssG [candidate division Zixibacteria bacterium]|nr:type VI secretion system baseplate subunit TssG [candidate division Zixibacteria bacterium]